MLLRIISKALVFVTALSLFGCLLETENKITADPKVDSRLEGVWQITEKQADEVRGERDEDDLGVYGYIIIAALEGQADTYKLLAFDSFEAATESKFPEMLISTRKHKGRNLLLVRLAEYEKKKAKEGDMTFKNWVVDYEFNESEELFLRFWSAEDFSELQKVKSMEFELPEHPFAPITLKGDEATLLEYYTDPKVRTLLSSLGKYRKLVLRTGPLH